MRWDPACFDDLDAGVAVYDPKGIFLYVNPSAAAAAGRGRDELLGERLWDLFPQTIDTPFHAAFQRVVASGKSELFEHHYAPWDRHYRNQIFSREGRIHVVSVDITEQKRAEARLSALARASEAFAGAGDLATLFATIARVMAEDIGDSCDVRMADAEGRRLVCVAIHHSDPAVLARLRELSAAPLGIDEGFTGRAYRLNTPVLVPKIERAQHLATFSDDRYRDGVSDLGLHSLMGAPLRDGERVIGVLGVGRQSTPRPYTEADLALLTDLAERASMAITRARLNEEHKRALEAERSARARVERQAEQTRRLQAVTASLSRRLQPREVAEAVLREGLHLMGGATGAIWMLNADGQALEILAAVGYPETQPYRRYALEADTPICRAARERQAIYLENAREYRERFPASVVSLGDRAPAEFAAACLPLQVEGRLLGAIAIAFASHHTFGDDERGFLDVLAGHGAQGLDRARLFEEERASTAALAETARRRGLLAETSVLLATSLDTREILNRLAELPIPGFADWCLVDLLTEDGSFDRVAVGHAAPTQSEVARRLKRRYAGRPELDLGVSRAMSRSQPHLATDFTDEVARRVARDPEHLELLRAMNVRSFVCAPLVVSGRSIGAVTWLSTGRVYDEADLALVEEVARRAAAVLDNVRLYEGTRALVLRLENIQRVTSELSRARTPAEVGAITVRHGTAAVGGEACLLYLADGQGGLTLLDGHGVPEIHYGRWRRFPKGTPMPALRVLATDQPLWIETDEDYQRHSGEVYEVQKAAGRLRSYCAIPLTISGRTEGVLVYSFPLGHRFSPDEREFLTTLTHQCAQALERAQLYAREAAARAEAETANRAKDEFLAMLGHELRNPLAPIVTALHLMKLRGDTRSSREQQVIERQVAHLLRLVDDLLDISRITRGLISLKKEPVDLSEAVAKAVEIASPLLEQKRHQLALAVPRGLRLDADIVRLAQVIANLLTNAARYTDPGGVISVEARRDGEAAVLSVRDNGVGIDPELLPRIFDLFVQDRRTSDRGQGGLGIGLSLVRSLVQLHGGEVTGRSAGPGKGSEFEIRLPATAAAASAEPSGRPAAPGLIGRTRRVLVVDDNTDAAELLAELLREAGHQVVLAHDGAQALRSVETFEPEVAILDLGLPVMDGYELAARLRERLPVRLAALTGYGQEHDRTRSLEAGFHAHFVKPVEPNVLLEYVVG